MNSFASAGQGLLAPLKVLENPEAFAGRHIGPDDGQISSMLELLGYSSLDDLVAAIVPASIMLEGPMQLDAAVSEEDALARLRAMLAGDRPGRAFIGMGYHDTRMPAVIQRNVLENPGWYTAYTPYQAEISQGRLECLLNYQQMVMDLTAMDLANASLLDEATAAAEAMALARRVSKNQQSNTFFVDQQCLPQTIDVLRTRAEGLAIELVIGDPANIPDHDVFGALLQYPAGNGAVADLSLPIGQLHEQQAVAAVAADIMSLVLLRPPGEMGADVVVGSTQRFGVPMGYGGPHAAYFATRDDYRRSVPGRIIGVSRDRRDRMALRMALQVREQHIRREKANSNICTAQVLLANISALYAMYHGPQGLRRIATRIHRLTWILAEGLKQKGLSPQTVCFFDTLSVQVSTKQGSEILARAQAANVHLRQDVGELTRFGISLDECSSARDVALLWRVMLGDEAQGLSVETLDQAICEGSLSPVIPDELRRTSAFLEHPHFNTFHSETEMLRYLKRLEDRDISLTRSMIPLGSCTMKLNATAEMLPVSWPEISRVHPFVPPSQVPGYQAMLTDFSAMLAEITGFDAISMQPNSGAQGEYAGLLAIRRYLDSQGQSGRKVCLIPSSAHGTNPASASMLGMQVVIVACDNQGNVDLDDLKVKADTHSESLAALMLTYPSTHGVFEEDVKSICRVIHEHGGQVYMDGANLNALVGIARPGDFGADVCHLNLHKTFCIPHGGGGPGMGPIGVRAHLAPWLSNHPVIPLDGPKPGNTAVSAAPWGSASILPISWMYIRMMGPDGLRKATQVAILNANYIARRLAEHYPVLYTGRNGMVAHECIIDLRPLRQSSGISESDVAKRLMDFGFHAPTMSFPVPGTLMIEPTESESTEELDRFIEAMIIIRQEIASVESGELDRNNNPLTNAPHTLADIMDDGWDRPYTRQQAAFPAHWVARHKYWPPVNRVDDVHGDRHFVCACPPLSEYEGEGSSTSSTGET